MKELLNRIMEVKAMAASVGRTAKVKPRDHEKLLEVHGYMVVAEKKLRKIMEGVDGN